jgi:hypothetical protein
MGKVSTTLSYEAALVSATVSISSLGERRATDQLDQAIEIRHASIRREWRRPRTSDAQPDVQAILPVSRALEATKWPLEPVMRSLGPQDLDIYRRRTTVSLEIDICRKRFLTHTPPSTNPPVVLPVLQTSHASAGNQSSHHSYPSSPCPYPALQPSHSYPSSTPILLCGRLCLEDVSSAYY